MGLCWLCVLSYGDSLGFSVLHRLVHHFDFGFPTLLTVWEVVARETRTTFLLCSSRGRCTRKDAHHVASWNLDPGQTEWRVFTEYHLLNIIQNLWSLLMTRCEGSLKLLSGLRRTRGAYQVAIHRTFSGQVTGRFVW